jgi:propanol-preferring alcohol dehydrogenase
MAEMMRSWHVDRPGPVGSSGIGGGDGLALRATPVPEPGPGELLLRVLACGVCRTDLHVTEGDLPVHRPGVTPGHEVVGEVVATGGGDASGFAPGDRAGAAWLRSTDGTCRYCRRGAENLCPASRYTGWDADGGYAEYLTVPAAYAHRLPGGYSDAELAPLLCAGIIGYRALRRAALPPGGRLGLYGFGGSAHLAAQVALAEGATLFVMTRGERAKELARSLGAAFVGDSADVPPEPLDSAILFAPVGDLVLPAMAALDRGGTLAIAGIYLSDIPAMSYEKYLFQERQVRSVTANTRQDAHEFLDFAGRHRLAVTTHEYPLDAAPTALADLKAGAFDGAAVLIPLLRQRGVGGRGGCEDALAVQGD